MSKFKIGDKVKVISAVDYRTGETETYGKKFDQIGNEYVIEELTNGGFYVSRGFHYVIEGNYYRDEDLKLIEPQDNKFKIGDKVKKVKNTYHRLFGDRELGETFIVDEVLGEFYSARNEKYRWSQEELELVETIAQSIVKSLDLKVGDRVKVALLLPVGPYSFAGLNCHWSQYMNELNKCGTITEISSKGFVTLDGDFIYPPFVLEKVTELYLALNESCTAIINSETIEIEGQVFPFEKLQELVDLARKVGKEIK